MKLSKVLVAVTVLFAMTTVLPAADTASISGKISFEGTAPRRKKIRTDADPKCAEMHADDPLLSEEVVVNPNNTLRNVFVYIKSGLEGRTYEPPKTPVEVDQTGCHYVPHVFGMMARQPLKIVNDDDTLHNIHAMPTKSKEFNVGQPNKGMSTMRTFAEPEIMVHLKCDVHPWMSAYVGVMSNPFYSVTGDDGTFSIKGLPAGEYEVAAWQEKYGEQTQKIKVGDGEAKTVDFTFKAE
ncbi:MAG TPA: carboxypeptidase regulatory-like domain-containing protein [Verrucomicrobiae bacterium]|nr:carboxypeptidase regulatory-like domain-containing protein [Verrucomicrobiae bacterium]